MKTLAALGVLLISANACKPKSEPAQPPPSSTSTAQNTLSDAEKTAGWRLLFDGQTTAGWRNYNKQNIAGWVVQDGALTRTDAGGDIITNDEFANFELSIDWKIEPGGNSGIFYRASEEKDDEIYWNAVEMQVLDDAKHPDGQNPLQSAGAAYDLYPAPRGHVHPGGEWNSARLIVNGNHVEHWLNGFKMVEYELGSRDWDSKVAASKFKPHAKFGKNTKGHIGLQDHGNVVAFRNIKIRTLP
jgi:hypothetical protein